MLVRCEMNTKEERKSKYVNTDFPIFKWYASFMDPLSVLKQAK